MASKPIPEFVDTVVVGNGPSALILSYILHGHIPYYNSSTPHPDPILHRKLLDSPCLFDIDIADLTAHFAASRLSYSTQALPANVLLDTLLRPLADTEPERYDTCIEWRFHQEKRVKHVVLGNTAKAGGQWADNPVSASWGIGTLSYSEMLSLPGYTIGHHYQKTEGRSVPDFYRPTRREVAEYLAAYPAQVGIQDAIYSNEEVSGVRRIDDGFCIGSHDVTCRNLVLASGTFANLIPPRVALLPLNSLPDPNTVSDAPLLVVGSGFTAADVIISTPPGRKIIHIFKWDPEGNPSPLRACHPRAYPEYASVYRHMKQAARNTLGLRQVTSPMRSRKSNPFFKDRDWEEIYEGLPNTYIKAVKMRGINALLTLVPCDGTLMEREISNMEYVIGRRGSLSYLDHGIAGPTDRLDEHHKPLRKTLISGKTLRSDLEYTLKLAPKTFVIGSLTGDSLIRFAYGGCVFAAREIVKVSKSRRDTSDSSSSNSSMSLSTAPSSPMAPLPNGSATLGGHGDLHLDRKRKLHYGSEETKTCGMCDSG
ncbi:hypothetical protein P7C71_g3696, partial [Lecanoromycetidae sp. Uapishka_2]